MGAPSIEMPRLVVAALGSGCGKTTVAAGLLAAWAERHRPVAGFKAGPDFLDPQVLSASGGGLAVRNLDPWLTSPARVVEEFRAHAATGPRALSVIEGAMGLFDTEGWRTSTRDIAAWLRAPIVLVVDAARSVESVAAEVRGTRLLLRSKGVAGVIVNRAAPGWHARTVRAAVESRGGAPVLGVLPFDRSHTLPERHLGLRTPTTDPKSPLSATIRALGRWVAEQVDLDRLEAIAERAPPLGRPEPARTEPRLHGRTLAVARDAAFAFVYRESLEPFEQGGARLAPFSPLNGEPIPPAADGVYLPGGYPELHAAPLERAETLRRELRAWVDDGRPTYAECGGMMYLLEELRELGGRRRRMVGALKGRTAMSARLGGFGFVTALNRRPTLYGPAGRELRGHLYHHSVRSGTDGTRWALELRPRSGGPVQRDGYARGSVLASYLHARLDAIPGFTHRLLGDRR